MFTKLEKQIAKLPREVKFCKLCVVSNQRPRITFNKEGVCSACEYAYQKQNIIDWMRREKELFSLCKKYRSRDGSFDVIVPVSGGKDSGWVAHQLKYVYGMHPLCVTWAPHIYTEIGWKNFQNFVSSGFDVIYCFPDGKLHRKLARVAFQALGDAWQPFTYGQKAYAYHIAIKFGISLIFFGENGEVEYGGSTKYINRPYELPEDFEEFYYKGASVDDLVEAGLRTRILKSGEIDKRTFELYRTPDIKIVKKMGIRQYWFSYFKKWIPQENFYYAQKNTGFTANEEGRSEGTYSKYASLDDKTDGFHFYLAFIKFGIGRATSDTAHEVRDGHITREEAVALVKRYDGEFPSRYFAEFLQYLDIDEKYFWKVVDSWRQPHIWKKVKGEWRLRHTVAEDGTDD